MPLAAPRRELPAWALILIGVLAAAVLLLGGAWWQSQRSIPSQATTPSTAATPPVASTSPATATATPVPGPAPTTASTPPPATPPSAIAAAPPQPAAVAASSFSARDLESAAGVEERGQSLATAAIVPKRPAPTGPTLPSAAALQAQGISVPALRLELHGYSDRPAERFVFINGHKYREGERLTEGPDVVTIEPNGVVLSQQGQRFLLAPE